MFNKLALLATLVLLLLPLAPSASPGSPDAKVIEGVWAPLKWTLAGSATPPPNMGKMRLTLKGGTYTLGDGNGLDEGKITIRQGLKPKEMDIVGGKGPNAGRTIPAIYTLQKDRLTICYGLDGHRPKVFESPEKSAVLLITYGRVKK